MIYLTRYDIENMFYKVDSCFGKNYRYKWHPNWVKIEVYLDSIHIYINKEDFIDKPEFITESTDKLKNIFGDNLITENEKVLIELDFDEVKLEIIYIYNEYELEKVTRNIPQFKNISERLVGNIEAKDDLPGASIYAFHSYKGGVGRTLSLLTFIREFGKEGKKVLVVDADIEAPGLTWLAEEDEIEFHISYLDVLRILMENDSLNENVFSKICDQVKKTQINIPSGKTITEHYFLPVYRYIEQIYSLPIEMGNFLSFENYQWIIADTLSRIGKLLGAAAVVVDLRAGISELSAPLLLDDRVQKIFVTSTSLQSLKGISSLLKNIYTKKITQNYPKVLVNMVNEDDRIRESDKWEKEILEVEELPKEELRRNDSEKSLVDTTIFEQRWILSSEDIVYIPFSEKLLHLTDLSTINKNLVDTDMEIFLRKNLWERFYPEKSIDINDSDEVLNKLYKLTDKFVTAENIEEEGFLVTESISSLISDFRDKNPVCIIAGMKGAGKTFAYSQILKSDTWESFVKNSLNQKEENSQPKRTIVIPLLPPRNMDISVYEAGIEQSLKLDKVLLNKEKTYDFINNMLSKETKTESEWKDAWKEIILNIFNRKFNDFDSLEKYLRDMNARILFLVDGIEEYFWSNKELDEKNRKNAIKALIQGIIYEFKSKRDNLLGLIVFIRKDILQIVIEQNFEQYYKEFKSYELRWNKIEALRLAYWLYNKCVKQSKDQEYIRKIYEYNLIEELEVLWGKKLGSNENEATSWKWIIGSLSDFNGVLQARDIVRFLKYSAKYSSEQVLKGTPKFNDRYLKPEAIRKSIQDCSTDKVRDIKDEMYFIRQIFEKLEMISPEKRTIPLKMNDVANELSLAEVKALKDNGFIYEETKEGSFYMPEIIHPGLGFKYGTRGRRKVISIVERAQIENK